VEPTPKTNDEVEVKTAILSVADKSGVVEFARGLRSFRIELLATGGTFTALRDAGVEVKSLGEALGLSEALSGRVKTLHSNLFAGILAKRGDRGHMQELKAMGVSPIDMVVCNFYPFEKVANDPSASDETIIENIDIGGPSMVRASVKNHAYVTVVPSARFYEPVLGELTKMGGKVRLDLRRTLAVEALATVRSHASKYPRDALPLSLALGVFGFLGFSGRRDHHEAQLALLEELATHWGDDWWFLGYLGWAYIETGEVAKRDPAGRALARRQPAERPRGAPARPRLFRGGRRRRRRRLHRGLARGL